jgi:hypothetical protein
MTVNKSRWQQEFDALPEWAQKMVRALRSCVGYGGSGDEHWHCGMTADSRRKYEPFQIILGKADYAEFFDGFCDMKGLAAALTAPWPPAPPPKRDELTTGNIVEIMTAGDDGNAFDQPCAFGHRVNGHAVYCHNDAWPNSPRKCRRNRGDSAYGEEPYLHEDCPGFTQNPDWSPDGANRKRTKNGKPA